MDADEILALERELTDAEFTFLEQDTLKLMRAIRKRVAGLQPRARTLAPEIAERLEISANRMLWALEQGAELPIGDKIAETAALKDLARQVRRMYVDIMGPETAEPAAMQAPRMPRRDRRRLGRGPKRRGPWTGPHEPADSTA